MCRSFWVDYSDLSAEFDCHTFPEAELFAPKRALLKLRPIISASVRNVQSELGGGPAAERFLLKLGSSGRIRKQRRSQVCPG